MLWPLFVALFFFFFSSFFWYCYFSHRRGCPRVVLGFFSHIKDKIQGKNKFLDIPPSVRAVLLDLSPRGIPRQCLWMLVHGSLNPPLWFKFVLETAHQIEHPTKPNHIDYFLIEIKCKAIFFVNIRTNQKPNRSMLNLFLIPWTRSSVVFMN